MLYVNPQILIVAEIVPVGVVAADKTAGAIIAWY